MKKICWTVLIMLFGLAACGHTPEASPPIIVRTAPAPPMPAVTDTLPLIPTATQGSKIFGAMNANDVQAQAIETAVNDIFKKTMDGLAANGSIAGYAITKIVVLPGEDNLLAEVTYNVKSDDPAWLADGGIQSTDGWINDNCSRFDLLITETELQLANRRPCG